MGLSRLPVHWLADQIRASLYGKEEPFMTRTLTCLSFYHQSLVLAIALVIAIAHDVCSQNLSTRSPDAFTLMQISDPAPSDKTVAKTRSDSST